MGSCSPCRSDPGAGLGPAARAAFRSNRDAGRPAAAWAASASTAAARRSWRPGGRSGSSSRARWLRARPTDATTSAQDEQPARWAATPARSRRSPSPASKAASCSWSGWSGRSGTLGYSCCSRRSRQARTVAATPGWVVGISRFGRWRTGVGSRGVDHSEWGAGGGWFGGVGEAVGEGGAAPEDAALHGADRDLQDLGGVGVGDPVEVAEDDRDPELLGDLGEGGLDGDGRGDHLAEVAAGGDGQAGVLRVEGGQAGPAPAAGLVGGGVHGDPVQPGREGGRLAEAGGLAEGGQEGLLGGVLGVLPVAEDPQAEAVDAAFVARDQLAEGPGVASQVGGEQGLVARDAHDRRTASAIPMRYPPPSGGRFVNQTR